MKIFLPFVSFLILSCNSFGQNILATADILRQTYLIQFGQSQGTCFLIKLNGQELLVTARHIFNNQPKNGDSVNIRIIRETEIKEFKARYFVHEDSTIDIAILKTSTSLEVIPPFSIDGQPTISQDCYFLGYPKFNNIQFSTYSKNLGMLPVVKKGIISAWVFGDKYGFYLLDGHNNPGFSGGPVICYDRQEKKTIIFGIISGYFHEDKPVKNKQGLDELTYVKENSGIIKCYPTDLIKQIKIQ